MIHKKKKITRTSTARTHIHTRMQQDRTTKLEDWNSQCMPSLRRISCSHSYREVGRGPGEHFGWWLSVSAAAALPPPDAGGDFLNTMKLATQVIYLYKTEVELISVVSQLSHFLLPLQTTAHKQT